jgi:hypothetical protein
MKNVAGASIKSSSDSQALRRAALQNDWHRCFMRSEHRTVTGVLSSAVERRPYKANVVGSIPSAPTTPLDSWDQSFKARSGSSAG